VEAGNLLGVKSMKILTLTLWMTVGQTLAATPPTLGKWLNEAVELTGGEYLNARSAIMKLGADVQPDLLRLSTDSSVAWNTQLVARICYEKLVRGKEIDEVCRHDWKSYPPYSRPGASTNRYGTDDQGKIILLEIIPPPPGHVEIPVSGPSYLMGDDVRKVLREAGLWYYYIEQGWKRTDEGPPAMRFDNRFMEAWTGWCANVVKEQPEKIWWARAVADRLEKSDFKDWRDRDLFEQLMQSGEGEAVPSLVRRFDDYFMADTKGREANPGSWKRSYPSRFVKFLPHASTRHFGLLEQTFNNQPLLEPLRPELAVIQARANRDETERLRFRLGSTLVEAPTAP
jgi:hypothetical protein